ncbi:hypothetical protein ACFL6C_11550 [Myxococcota bacterium]
MTRLALCTISVCLQAACALSFPEVQCPPGEMPCSTGCCLICAKSSDCGAPCSADNLDGDACVRNLCVPACHCLTSCQKEGANCGVIPDGCGGTLDCGVCTGGETCGGSAAGNVCGRGDCVPTTCELRGVTCGAVSDGCSGILECGTCDLPETCGGNGAPNVCGCSPLTCLPGVSCGAEEVFDCVGACVSAASATAWIGDGSCDDGSYGMVLTCPEFEDDGGDCECPDGGCEVTVYCGNGACDEGENCHTCSDCTCAPPGTSCGDGRVYDCVGVCVSAASATAWIGDGYCDDGTYGMVLTCPEFDDDAGDCPAAECSDDGICSEDEDCSCSDCVCGGGG